MYYIFISEKALFVIFKDSEKTYITSTEDGLKWATSKYTRIKDDNDELLFYSGPSFEFPGMTMANNSLFICLGKSIEIVPEVPEINIAYCHISTDEGSSWNNIIKISVNKEFSEYR